MKSIHCVLPGISLICGVRRKISSGPSSEKSRSCFASVLFWGLLDIMIDDVVFGFISLFLLINIIREIRNRMKSLLTRPSYLNIESGAVCVARATGCFIWRGKLAG